MIEKYFVNGAVISGFDFTDVSGSSLSEVSEGIVSSSMSISAVNVNFRFLPYAQGAINYCESQGKDILSAYFSGCIMASYVRSGSGRVCHVSTGGPNDCKDKWEQIQGENVVKNVSQFKPHEHVTAGDKILGLITSTGERFAIGCSATVIEQKETRSVKQILVEHTFTSGTTKKEKKQLAKFMVKGMRRVAALEVKCCVNVK